MEVSQNGINLIKKWEGCRLSAYKCPSGVVTIGYGTTNAVSGIIGKTITMGMTITQQQAEDWLRKTVNARYVPNVRKYQNTYHFNQNEFDALVSFCYNLGSIDGLVSNGKLSKDKIPQTMLLYNKAGGKVCNGLVNRRNDEVALFKKGGPSSNKKSVNEIAREVIAGKWGNGEERKRRLAAEGYNYNEVQNEVNRLLK